MWIGHCKDIWKLISSVSPSSEQIQWRAITWQTWNISFWIFLWWPILNQIILHDSVWELGIWSRVIIKNSMITINNNNSDLLLLYHCLMRVVYLFCSLLSQEITKRIPHRMQTQSLDSSRDTLLSQDVAVSLLQENKMALKRCELVRRPNTVMKHMWISR